jgi:hypothetical protein
MLKWFRRRRDASLEPFPREWSAILDRNVPYYRLLPPDQRARLRSIAQVLLAEKHFEGCRGFVVTDEMKVTIAGHAACLLLGREGGYFPKLKTILLYPTMFFVQDEVPEPDGTVAEVEDEHAGQSWDLGVVVLAWDEVVLSAERSGDAYNVVLHEFAHQLDAAASGTDGAPRLDDPALRARWADVMQRHYERLERDVRRGRRTLLDPYALEAPAEFFAVATETFFEAPTELRRHHPELYALLRDYYRQDPAHLPGAL